MSLTANSVGFALIKRLLTVHSIRTKLLIGFGVLLALGAFNIGVYYWGAYQREKASGPSLPEQEKVSSHLFGTCIMGFSTAADCQR